MAGSRNYIPSGDKAFDVFFKNLVDYVTQKCSRNNPKWTHIPKKSLDGLIAAYNEWHTAYEITLKPHTTPETDEKNRVKKVSTKVLRDFVNEFLRYSSMVTDKDRNIMGINNRKPEPTPVSRPQDAPEFTVRPKENRILEVHFRPAGSKSKAKPYGYDGAIIYWGVLDTPPTKPEDFPHHELATKTPFIIEFQEAQRGQKVYTATRWQNKKGETGPLSDIQVTVVP